MSTPDNNRGNDKKNAQQATNPAAATPDQGRSAFSAGTGKDDSEPGQRSSQLGGEAYKQEHVAGKESNDENEPGKVSTEQAEEETQKTGGTTGFDTDREQQQANNERQDASSKRDQDQADIERPQVTPDEQKDAGKQPDNPDLH